MSRAADRPYLIDVLRIWRHGNVNWALLDQALVSGVNFAVGVLLARFLGPREFGVFTLAWVAVLIVTNLQLALIVSPMMSIGPKHITEDAPAYFGAVAVHQVIFAVLSSVLVLGGVILFAGFGGSGVRPLALPLAAVGAAMQLQDFLRRYFFARTRAVAAFANDAICYLGQLLLLVGLYATSGLTASRALWAMAGAATGAVVIGLISVERLVFTRKAVRSVADRHLHFSKWLGGSALAQVGAVNFFFVAAAGALGAAAAGGMKAARNVMGVTHVLFMGLENVVPSEASRRLRERGVPALNRYTRSVGLWGMAATGMFALVVIVAPEFWLTLFYGSDFAPYGGVLRWFAVVYVVSFAGTPLRAWLRAWEDTRPIFVGTAVMLVVSLTTGYPLSRRWGLDGVMAAMLLSFVCLQAVLILGVNRRRKLVTSDVSAPAPAIIRPSIAAPDR